MESKEKGWVVISEDKSTIYDFTYSRLRADAQRKYAQIWDNDFWDYHYRKGVRCVKAEMTIKVENIKE